MCLKRSLLHIPEVFAISTGSWLLCFDGMAMISSRKARMLSKGPIPSLLFEYWYQGRLLPIEKTKHVPFR